MTTNVKTFSAYNKYSHSKHDDEWRLYAHTAKEKININWFDELFSFTSSIYSMIFAVCFIYYASFLVLSYVRKVQLNNLCRTFGNWW